MYNRQQDGHPLQHTPTGTGTDSAGGPTSNQLTPSSKRPTFQDGSAPAQRLFATDKTTPSSGQSTHPALAHQATRGKQLAQHKATSTDPLPPPDNTEQDVSTNGKFLKSPSPHCSKSEGKNENHHGVNPQAKRTPLPKRTYVPTDLVPGEKNVVQDDDSESAMKQENDTKGKGEKDSSEKPSNKRKSEEKVYGRYGDEKDEDEQDAPSSDSTIAPDVDEDSDNFDPTAPVRLAVSSD